MKKLALGVTALLLLSAAPALAMSCCSGKGKAGLCAKGGGKGGMAIQHGAAKGGKGGCCCEGMSGRMSHRA